MIELRGGDFHGVEADFGQYPQASGAEAACKECYTPAQAVPRHFREEIRRNLELAKALEEGDRPAGELYRPRLRMNDLIGIDDLRFDAVGACLGCGIDELPGARAIAAV